MVLAKITTSEISPRSWRDFASECFCFGCEDVNGIGEAVGGLVKSRVELHSTLHQSRIPRSPAMEYGGPAAQEKITDSH